MGIARLLAKGWIVFCLFAGGHALHLALENGESLGDAAWGVVVPVLLFAAMGLLFVGGFGASATHGVPLISRLRRRHFIPGFNDLVFIGFVILSFVVQVFFAPGHIAGGAAGALQSAIGFIVPGQRALEDTLSCGLDGGRIFASAFAWLLAIIYIASAVSRLRLASGIIRLERATWPEPMGSLTAALVLGAFAIVGIQLFFMGTMYPWLSCAAFADIAGALLIGLAPLALAYLIVAALASALATGPE
jgi:hypothetical protein